MLLIVPGIPETGLTHANDAGDDLDPASTEWVCARAPERVRLLFDQLNLDAPGLESVRQAVQDADYPSACTALIQYYRGTRITKRLQRRVVKDTSRDDPAAEPILSDELEFLGERATLPRARSGGIDWSYGGPRGDPEWGERLNDLDYLVALMDAYTRTGRRKYLERVDADTRDWILAHPRPPRATKRGAWRGLGVAARSRTFTQVFYGLQAFDELSPATRVLILWSVVEHAQHLMLFHRRDAGGWAVAEVAALGVVGCAWPEFRDAAGWRAYSQERVGEQMASLVYRDGSEAELSCRAQLAATETLDDYVTTFGRFGYPLADSVVVGVKRMWTYLAFTLRPGGAMPQNNDTDLSDIRERLQEAGRAYDRPDWTYIATGGREGRKPRMGPSITFPWAGHAVMRSGWDVDAHWSFFDAGAFGVADGHHDVLHLSVDGHGRALLVDAGRFQYSSGPFRDYFVGSAGHNVLLIDGAGQKKTAARAQRPMAGADYGSTPEFDWARGIFGAGFEGVSGRVEHTRTVVYLRKQFWIVADRVETDRPRRVRALWHFAPECSVVVEGRTVASVDDGLGNLRVAAVGGIPWRTTVVAGGEDPVQGWYSDYHTDKAPSPTAIFEAHLPGTTTFAWVLVPARGAVPPVDAQVLSSGVDRIEVRVRTGGGKGVVVTVPMNSWRPSVRRDG